MHTLTLTPTRTGYGLRAALYTLADTLADAIAAGYARWQQQRLSRCTEIALASLDDRLLADLGLSRSDARSLALGDGSRLHATHIAFR